MKIESSRLHELFNELIEHLSKDEEPSIYLNEIAKLKEFNQYPFSMINRLKDTKQSPIHHPEGSAFNHTLLVVDEAAKVREKAKDKHSFMLAALLHDIGKPDTTRERKGKITSYDHDKVGAKLTREFLLFFEWDEEVIDRVVNLVLYHMHILYITKDLPFANKKGLLRDVDIEDLALLGLCDRLGRSSKSQSEEEEVINDFLMKVNQLSKRIK